MIEMATMVKRQLFRIEHRCWESEKVQKYYIDIFGENMSYSIVRSGKWRNYICCIASMDKKCSFLIYTYTIYIHALCLTPQSNIILVYFHILQSDALPQTKWNLSSYGYGLFAKLIKKNVENNSVWKRIYLIMINDIYQWMRWLASCKCNWMWMTNTYPIIKSVFIIPK